MIKLPLVSVGALDRTPSCRQRGDLDGIAEVLKSGDQTFGLCGFGTAIEVITAEVLIAGSILEHVVDGGEDGSGDGGDGLFGAAP